MDPFSGFVTSMVALSVGAERIVDILKQIFLGEKGKQEGVSTRPRRVGVHLTAFVVATLLVGFIGPHFFLDQVPTKATGTGTGWEIAALLGLVASGGSAFWNHVLGILGAVKTVRESVAKTTAQEDAKKKADAGKRSSE